MRVALIGLLLIASTSTGNAQEDWTAYNDCMLSHARAVAIYEPSILSGAELIVRTLCVTETTELANAMIRSYPEIVEQKGFGEAFESFLRSMEHEARRSIYELRWKANQ